MDQSEGNNKESNEDLVLLTRRDKFIIGIAVIVVLVVFFLYLYFFSGGFSDKHNEWGLFGDYFGGTVGPILSFVTIVILIYTLRIGYKTLTISKQELEKATDMLKLAKDELNLTQVALEQSKDEVKLAKEATERQVEHLENESFKNEISTILKEIDSDIQSIFKTNYKSNDAYILEELFTEASPTKTTVLHPYKYLDKDDKFNIDRLHNLLTDMESYLNDLDMKFSRPPLSYYYKRKYGKTAKIIEDYLPDDFEDFQILGR